MPTGKHLSDSVRQQLVAAYDSGLSGPEVAAMFGLQHKAVYRALRIAGKASRTVSEGCRLCALDEDFFASIDSETKAYWLGFITADGNVQRTTDRGRVMIDLEFGDRPHLERMAADLKSGLPVADYHRVRGDGRKQFRSRAVFNSCKMADDLIRLGVTPKKSHTVRPWQATQTLAPHYWRGVFDGDGSISRSRTSSEFKGDGKQHVSTRWETSLVGSRWVVQGFADFLADNGVEPKEARPKQNIFKVSYAGVALPQLILRLLYREATVFLARKKSLADELLAATPRQPYLRGVNAGQLAGLFALHGRWDLVAKALGCHMSGLLGLRKRLNCYTDGREHSHKFRR